MAWVQHQSSWEQDQLIGTGSRENNKSQQNSTDFSEGGRKYSQEGEYSHEEVTSRLWGKDEKKSWKTNWNA